MKPSCAKCENWQPKDRDAGECRAYAPQPPAMEASFSRPKLYRVWPITFKDDWCGEFAPGK